MPHDINALKINIRDIQRGERRRRNSPPPHQIPKNRIVLCVYVLNVYDIMYLIFPFICAAFVALSFYILCYDLGSLVVSIKTILRPPHAPIKHFWIHPLVHDITL